MDIHVMSRSHQNLRNSVCLRCWVPGASIALAQTWESLHAWTPARWWVVTGFPAKRQSISRFCMLLIAKSTNGKTLKNPCVHRTQLKKVAASNNVGHRSIFVSFPLLLQPLDGLLLPAFDIHVAFDLGVRRSCWEREKGQLLQNEETVWNPPSVCQNARHQNYLILFV